LLNANYSSHLILTENVNENLRYPIVIILIIPFHFIYLYFVIKYFLIFSLNVPQQNNAKNDNKIRNPVKIAIKKM
jgi:hypothetical protein